MNLFKRNYIVGVVVLCVIAISIAQPKVNNYPSNIHKESSTIERKESLLDSSGMALDNLENILNSKLNQFSNLGYFSQIYESSLQATYYGLYILNALGKLDLINLSKVAEMIMSNYNTSSHIFTDSYAKRYLDTDFDQIFYPYTSILETNCYALLSLAISGKLDLIDVQHHIDFIHSCYNPATSGFIGQPYSPSLHPNFRNATMDNTYYAIITLQELGDDWSGYSSQKTELIAYIRGLQSDHPWEWYYGGFFNDNNTDFDSLNMFEPNLLSCYYCIKSLEYFGEQSSIRQSDIHQYMNGIYNEQGNYFDMCYFHPFANETNLIATALGLQLTDLTNNSYIDRDGVIDFILQNRNDWKMWDRSTSFSFHELMDTFQVIRALYECGEIYQINSTEKDYISQYLLSHYFQYNYCFSLLSNDYTTIELLNSIINAFSLSDRLSELDISYINNYITDLYHYAQYPIYDEHSFYMCRDIYQNNGQGASITGFRSYPIEFYTRSNKLHFNEIEYFHSLKSTFFALDSLLKMNRLSSFNESNDLTKLLNDIVEYQFLDPSYENHGGFISMLWFRELSKDFQVKNVFLPYTYYAIKNLEILSGLLGLNNVSDTGIDTDALYSYINNHIVNDSSYIYCDPKYSIELETVLENTFYMIYSLKALGRYTLDDVKIQNFVLSNVNYSNIKNVYYSYKILQVLGGKIELNPDLTYMLINKLYSASFQEYYMSTEKKEISQEILLWISDMLYYGFGNSTTVLNIEYLENLRFMSIGNNITFSINSSYGGNYWVWINNDLLDSHSFSYGKSFFSYSLDSYSDYLGDYVVKINATALDGTYAETSASFSVYSASSTVVNILDLSNYEFMTFGNNITFQINCEYPDRYNFTIDGVEIASGAYINGQVFTFTIDNYFVGIHNVSIWARGLDGKEGTAHASFTVYSMSETSIQVHSIENYILDTIGHYINFSVSSLYPDSYWLSIDDTQIACASYLNADPILISLDGYTIGIHLITIWANASDGKEAQYKLEFYVFAESFIYIDIIALPNYEFKTVGHNITFMINASFPESFQFFIDDVLINSGIYQFGGTQFSFSIDNYFVGEHNITIWANGTTGKVAELKSSFTVYSLSSTIVSIENLADYEFNTTGHFLNYSISSYYPDYYTLYIDSSLQVNKSYENNILYSFSVDEYDFGYHTIFIWAIGEDGKIGTASSGFWVYSNSSTLINLHSIPSYFYEDIGNFINFSISSKYRGSFNLSVDGNLVHNDTYYPEANIVWCSDNYSVGIHSVQISAICIDGKQAIYQTDFSVYSNSSTLILIFNLTGIRFMSLGNFINFTIYSEYPDYFELWIDDRLLYTNNFTSGISLLLSLDAFSNQLGNHSVYIWAVGKDFVVGAINAIFTVYSTSITRVQINQLYDCEFGSEDNHLIFTIYSDYPDYYELWIDTSLIYSGFFTNGIPIVWSLDNYTSIMGTHIIYIYAVSFDQKTASITSAFDVQSQFNNQVHDTEEGTKQEEMTNSSFDQDYQQFLPLLGTLIAVPSIVIVISKKLEKKVNLTKKRK